MDHHPPDRDMETLFANEAPQRVSLQMTREKTRVAKLAPPARPVSFDQWRAVIKENFPALASPAEIGLSVVAQLLLNDVSNPFALALVDVPASGKTITLNFFDGTIDLTYTTDNFTPASFVTH